MVTTRCARSSKKAVSNQAWQFKKWPQLPVPESDKIIEHQRRNHTCRRNHPKQPQAQAGGARGGAGSHLGHPDLGPGSWGGAQGTAHDPRLPTGRGVPKSPAGSGTSCKQRPVVYLGDSSPLSGQSGSGRADSLFVAVFGVPSRLCFPSLCGQTKKIKVPLPLPPLWNTSGTSDGTGWYCWKLGVPLP